VRGTDRYVIVWDCYWLLVGAVGEAAVRVTERNGFVWDWNREFFEAGCEKFLR